MKNITCVKKSYSIPAPMAAWLERAAKLRAGAHQRPNESRLLVSLLRPAFDARHSDKKRDR